MKEKEGTPTIIIIDLLKNYKRGKKLKHKKPKQKKRYINNKTNI